MDAEGLNKESPVGEIIIKSRNRTHKIDLYPTMDIDDLYAQHSQLYQAIFYVAAVLATIFILSFALIIKKLRRDKRKRFY